VRFEHVDVFWAGEVMLIDVGEGVHCKDGEKGELCII
jgi:hypothetical protein